MDETKGFLDAMAFRNADFDLRARVIAEAFAEVAGGRVVPHVVPRSDFSRGDVIQLAWNDNVVKVFYAVRTPKYWPKFQAGELLVTYFKKSDRTRWWRHFDAEGKREGDFFGYFCEGPSGQLGCAMIDLRVFRDAQSQHGSRLVCGELETREGKSYLLRPVLLERLCGGRKLVVVNKHGFGRAEPGLLSFV